MHKMIGEAPGPPAGWLAMRSAREFARDPLEFSQRMVQEHGPLVALRFGPVRAFIVADPEAVHDVLVTKSKHYRKERRTKSAVNKMAGNGIIASEGPFWLRQRRMMQQGFTPQRMEGYANVVVDCANEMLGHWPGEGTLEVAREMSSLSLKFICQAMFQFEISGVQAYDWADAAEVLSESVVQELGAMIPIPDWLPIPTKRRKQHARFVLEDAMRSIIRERRQAGVDKGDMLSALIAAEDVEGDGTKMNDQQILDECLTLLHAGYDSTAAGMTWCWYLLAQHPEIQQQAVDEARQVLQNERATYADFDQLVFIQQVIQETMRLYPPAWMLMLREATQETELIGCRVPRGSWIYLVPWVTHRSERWFNDPLRFDPERFSKQRLGEFPRNAYYPFGKGGHFCIGEKLAMTEMTLAVATVLRKYQFSLPADHCEVEIEPHTAIRPRGGLRLEIRRREEVS